MYDMICFGSATSDVFVDTGLHEINRKIAYPVGAKIPIKHLEFAVGGVGVNVAVGLARLGLKTAYLGKLGDDWIAKDIFKTFNQEKVNFIGKKAKGFTGYGIILDSYEKNRTILTSHGLVDHYKFNEINKNKIKTKWIFFSSLKGESLKSEEKLIFYAKKKGIKLAFNMDAYVAKKAPIKLKKILQNLDLIILNKEEGQSLVNKKEIKEIAIGIHKLGPKIAVVTDGKNKVCAFDGVNLCFVKPHKIKVIERTGAGDAFTSGFLGGLIKTDDIKFALKSGLANSESVIQYFGAQNKLLKWNEMLRKIKK